MTNDALLSLTGMVTPDGWTIGELVRRQAFQTGGCFSVGYIATHSDGRQGFLKALDVSRALKSADATRAMEWAFATFNFEKDVLALCRGANLDRVVVALSDGELDVPAAPMGRVFYLIFELAEGDVRKHAVLQNKVDPPWILRSVHQIATGARQLHGKGIYHQDLKPSNVLVFSNGQMSKLADLGRAHCNSIASPHEHIVLAGVPYYAPPEQLYTFSMGDRNMERAAADLYLLGSMLYFLFMGTLFTPALVSYLRDEHHPPRLSASDGGWMGTFDDVLTYLIDAHSKVLADFEEAVLPHFEAAGIEDKGRKVVSLLQALTFPDPRRRGHPGNKAQFHGSQFELQRFVSAFDYLASTCEIPFRRANAKAA